MAELFVSCVGRQPAPVAVTLKTWCTKYDLDKIDVLFLATRQTLSTAKRLKNWAQGLGISRVNIETVAPSFADSDDLPSAGTALTQFVASLASPPHVVCHADPGFKSMVLSLIDALNKQQEPYTRLHAHFADLQVFDVYERDVEPVERINLANLGVMQLLELYDLKLRARPLTTARVHKLSTAAHDGFIKAHRRIECVVCDVPGSRVELIIAAEKRGRLFGLVSPRGGDSTKQPQTKAREILHLAQAFSPLQIELTGMAHGAVAAHLRNEGVASISPRHFHALRKWFNGQFDAPGSVAPPGVPSSAAPEDLGPPLRQLTDGLLIEVLGLDPSANLISLATHAHDGFDKALLVYDPGVPRLVARALHMRKALEELGYAQARFLASPYLQTVVNGNVVAKVGRDALQNIRVDVTPGTKAQACDFLTAIANPRALWTVQGAQGIAQSLDGLQQLPLRGPGILAWARAMSGPVNKKTGRALKRNKFYAALAEWLPGHPINGKSSFEQWFKKLIASERSKSRNPGVGRFRSGKYFAAALSDPKRKRAVCHNARDFGFMFEHLVGECFRALPHDELRIGIEWSWDKETLDRINQRRETAGRAHRCEIDLVMRRGHRVLCISCKSSAAPGKSHNADVKEIEAVATAGFGRFTIPVLVRSYIDPQLKRRSIEARRGAVLLDMSDLMPATELGNTLDEAIRNRIPIF